MKQPPGTPAKHFETVKDLREFLADYEDDDLLLLMLHNRVAGGNFAMYQGYYPLGGTDQEGNPVLFVNQQRTSSGKQPPDRDFERGDIIEIPANEKPLLKPWIGLRIEVIRAEKNWVTGKVLKPACPDQGYPRGKEITFCDASAFVFVENLTDQCPRPTRLLWNNT